MSRSGRSFLWSSHQWRACSASCASCVWGVDLWWVTLWLSPVEELLRVLLTAISPPPVDRAHLAHQRRWADRAAATRPHRRRQLGVSGRDLARQLPGSRQQPARELWDAVERLEHRVDEACVAEIAQPNAALGHFPAAAAATAPGAQRPWPRGRAAAATASGAAAGGTSPAALRQRAVC
eukprot:85958-Chlamydomonas_euryale.AAC.1